MSVPRHFSYTQDLGEKVRVFFAKVLAFLEAWKTCKWPLQGHFWTLGEGSGREQWLPWVCGYMEMIFSVRWTHLSITAGGPHPNKQLKAIEWQEVERQTTGLGGPFEIRFSAILTSGSSSWWKQGCDSIRKGFPHPETCVWLPYKVSGHKFSARCGILHAGNISVMWRGVKSAKSTGPCPKESSSMDFSLGKKENTAKPSRSQKQKFLG